MRSTLLARLAPPPITLTLVLTALAFVAIGQRAEARATKAPPTTAGQGPYLAFHPIELSFNMNTLASVPSLAETSSYGTSPNKHPFLDYRLTAKVTPPGGMARTVAGFFAADGSAGDLCTGDIPAGSVWKLRFTPENNPGTWVVEVFFEEGVGTDGRPINISDDVVPSPSTQVTQLYATTLAYTTSAYDPSTRLSRQGLPTLYSIGWSILLQILECEPSG